MTDPNAGKGGTYIRDPETGERKLVQRTEPAVLATARVGAVGPEAVVPTTETKAPKAVDNKGK